MGFQAPAIVLIRDENRASTESRLHCEGVVLVLYRVFINIPPVLHSMILFTYLVVPIINLGWSLKKCLKIS